MSQSRALALVVAIVIGMVVVFTPSATPGESTAMTARTLTDTVYLYQEAPASDTASSLLSEGATDPLAAEITADADGAISSSGEASDPDTPVRMEEEVYRISHEAARRYFAAHLAMIDTMKTSRSAELATIRYWKHLAKKDVKAQLQKKMDPNNPYIDQLMEIAAKTIDKYSEQMEGADAEHWNRSPMHRAQTVITTVLEDGSVKTQTLQENGSWQWHINRGRIR